MGIFFYSSQVHICGYLKKKNLKLAENEHERVRQAEREGNEKKVFRLIENKWLVVIVTSVLLDQCLPPAAVSLS
jgi:hypothetical protein